MEAFAKGIDTLVTVVTGIGAGLAIWGLIQLLEGYAENGAGAKANGIKLLMAGGGIILIAQAVIPSLKTFFPM